MTIQKFYLTSLLFVAFFVLSPGPAFAKDQWVQVRTKNFYLIGNASERDVRKVATKLEQFRETFRQIFKSMKVDSAVPTNVVVFKSDASYKPFKPRRGDGKADNLVAGYFQPGEDVNYVTLTTEGTDDQTFSTIFHEYVHFIIETNFGKLDVPSWFNEGLAEYYSTFRIEEDQKVHLGYPDGNHLMLLKDSKLIPLKDLFSNNPKNYGGSHGRSIFYAQSWALIHYLVLTGKDIALDKFILGSVSGKDPEQTFRDAFGMGYAEMEKELRKYVGKQTFQYHSLTFKNKLTFETEMVTTPLSEAESNAYLGDLLAHTHRPDDAEPFLKSALALDADSSLANTAMGMVKVNQRKYADAIPFFDKATKDGKNHLALYRYAELILREGQDEFGYMTSFEAAKVARMRELLKKAIAVKPSFTESYEMLALLALVNNDGFDEAMAGIQTALKYRPGHMRYVMRLAELYARQQKFDQALQLADKIAKNADEEDIRARAEGMAAELRKHKDALASYEAERKKFEEAQASRRSSSGEPVLVRRRPGEANPTDEQLAKAAEAARLRALNESMREPATGETRVIGELTKIECKGKGVGYSVTTPEGAFQLSSKDFQGLFAARYIGDGEIEIGCDSKFAGQTAVLTYRPGQTATGLNRGELVAVEFVPKDFQFVNLKEDPPPALYIVEETAGGPPPGVGGGQGISVSPDQAQIEADFQKEHRNSMLQQIAESIRKPGAGEKRVLAFIEKSECTNKGIFYHIKVGTEILKLSDENNETTLLKAYTPDVQNLQIGCAMKSVEIPVVVVYKEATGKKPKVAGDVLSLEFVPRSFVLTP